MDDKLLKEFIEWEDKFSEKVGKDDNFDPLDATIFVLEKTYKSQERLNNYTKVLAVLTGVLVVLTAVLIYYTIT